MGLGRLAIAGQDTWRRNFWLCAGEVGVRAFAERIRHTSRGVARRGLGRVQAAPMRPPSPGFFISVDGSVDIPGTVLISRVDKKRLTVFSDGAGRSRTPALCSRGAGSGHTGFASLPHALQQTSVHPAAVAGGAVPDALRRLDFREAETRLREHQELRAALKLREVPDYTTLYRFLRRLDDVTVERGLGETVRRLRRRRRRAVSVAIDGTGLSYNSVSTFFIRRLEQHADRSARHRHWLKWVIVVDVQQQILLAQRAHQGPGSDVRSLPGLLDVAARGAPIRLVLADAEFDSEPNHQHIRQRLGAKSIIPAKRRGI